MKKLLQVFVICVVCCLLSVGCANSSDKARVDNEPDKGQQKEEAASSVKSGEQTEAPSPAVKDNKQTSEPRVDDYNVCLIGNSLIQYGAQYLFLHDIALSYGKQISVDQITWGGAYLSDYVDGTYMDIETVKNRLQKADIIVFQDYGGWQGKSTVDAIRKLEKWCKKGARFYYYMYDDDYEEMESSDYKKLRKLKLQPVPKGQLIAALYDMSYSYEELHMENDFHPNIFNGYMGALTMYGVIFDEKCADFPKDWFLEDKTGQLTGPMEQMKEFLRGESQEEKWKEFQRICQKADQLIRQSKKYR